ncbi:MAG: hypothetical protein P1U44_11685 [Vicingaceae bacterium]|nr:hypothetical protein [Flavobacteriales bacterium]MDF1676367.1 hypothetical protein [Vicingaceae bacterium]
MEVKLLPEPLIEFANDFLCEDPKKGISSMGFFSLSNNSHKSEISYAVIGSKKEIKKYKEWLGQFESFIESTSSGKALTVNHEIDDETGMINELFGEEENTKEDFTEDAINKKANPDFPGFNSDSCFKCKFINNSELDYLVPQKKIDDVLNSKKKKKELSDEIISIYKDAYSDLLEDSLTGKPDIIVIVIPDSVFKKVGNVKQVKGDINFRRKLKAEILGLGLNVPIQLILESTVDNTKKSIQDLSQIAWNYCIAQYYKTGNCIPWTIKDIDADTCYLGISFNRVLDGENNRLQSSIAQAFNKGGKGLVFTGKQFEWRKEIAKVATPHLKYEYAKELIINVLSQYQKINKHTPKRVVIHKTSDFWDTYNHPDYNETGGLLDGIKELLGDETEVDLVSLKSSKIRMLRNGDYPVLRGSLFKLSDEVAILYTNGYIPYFNTYQGAYTPAPLEIENIGETPIDDIAKEILALTKMNFNNSDYCDGLPITIQFSSKVGEIIQYFPKDSVELPNKYYFYM